MAICAIFTQSITAKSILLSSIGEQQNSGSIWQDTWQQLLRWRQKSSNASMMSPFFTFSGESSMFYISILQQSFWITGHMGKSKISWPLYFTPGDYCRGKV